MHRDTAASSTQQAAFSLEPTDMDTLEVAGGEDASLIPTAQISFQHTCVRPNRGEVR
jgi:hypothetical protein